MKALIKKLIKESIQVHNLKKKSCSCGCNTCEDKRMIAPILNESIAPREILSEGLKYHIDNNKPLTEHVYRAGSQNYFNLWSEARALYSRGIIDIKNQDDLEILTETQLGEFGIYEGKKVPLDYIFEEIEEKKELDEAKITTDNLLNNPKTLIIDKETSIRGTQFKPEDIISVQYQFDDDNESFYSIKGYGQNNQNIKILYIPKKEMDNFLKNTSLKEELDEANYKNTHNIILNFTDDRLLNRFKTTPALSKRLAPNQIKNLKIGDNNLTVNNVALNGLERFESRGLYKLSKNIDEAKKAKKKNPPIGKPKRGGSKKFYVYVRKPGGGIKKVSFGDTTGLSAKINNPEARRAFAKRHDCANKKDRTKASYWSCRLPRYAKLLGLKSNFSGFW
jgi:hypothetical protein